MTELTKHRLQDTKQTSWQLAAIQLAGWMSLPTLATSIYLLQVNSFIGAILTILVGNGILWFIRLGIVGMAHKKRLSTLDISRAYFGKTGSYFIAALLLVSTLAWFIAQTSAAGSALTNLLNIHEDPHIDQFTQMSVFLGLISAFLCMEGIPLLRRLSTLAFPVLIVAFFTILFTLPSRVTGGNTNAMSLSGLTLILATNLGLSSDLPTFFRHSKSWSTSVRGLLAIQLVSVALGIACLYFGSIVTESFGINHSLVMTSGNEILRFSLILFIFVSVICANVANVYSASVGWEVLAPAGLVGRKEYLILGLTLTTIFILFSDLVPVELLLSISDISLVSLCIILVLGSMITKQLKKEPDKCLQISYFLAWFLSSAVDIVQSLYNKPYSLPLNLAIILVVICCGLAAHELLPRFRKKKDESKIVE
jgi:purine-cytosine permease-like protein